jgi:hypothetical protein
MKHLIVLFSCLLLLSLSSSCEKAGQIHLISAQTWVVTDISGLSAFANVGDELTFMDNRLFFKISNDIETDGRWDFIVQEGALNPTASYAVESLFVATGFGSYDFSVIKLTSKELELEEISNFGSSFTIRLEAKE